METGYVFLALVAVAVGVAFLRSRTITIMEFKVGLLYRKGRFIEVRGPGKHRFWAGSVSATIVDMREEVMTVPGQEVVSSDGASIKVSLTARFRVTDPERAYHEFEDWREALYTDLQISLREVVGSRSIGDLLEQRSDLGTTMLEAAVKRSGRLGVEVSEVEIRDIMLPGDLKRSFTQVVTARQEGLAALERARGETAALRHLANAAESVEKHPALMHLRVLQTLAASSGHSIVLNLGSPESLPAGSGD